MKIRPLGIEGAWEVVPQQHGDARGRVLEWYRLDRLAEAVGHPLRLAQANMSVNARGALRGIHFALVPPSQAKYVTCTRGAVLDVVVDIRVGSPTFGQWEAVRLDDADRRAMYIAEGLGHGFCALTDDATVVYLVSETFNPAREFGIHPFDPELDIRWTTEKPTLSPRDAAAPSLAQARAEGLLPSYADCQAYTAALGDTARDTAAGSSPGERGRSRGLPEASTPPASQGIGKDASASG